MILEIDCWLISQHQKVADWAYSRWDEVSPYWIASQLFGVVALLAILRFGFDSQHGLDTNLGLFAVLTHLTLAPIQYLECIIKHNLWKRNKLSAHDISMFEFFMRPLWVGIMLFGVFIFLFAKGYTETISVGLIVLFDVAIVAGFYFKACKPPTFIDRRKHVLAPETT